MEEEEEEQEEVLCCKNTNKEESTTKIKQELEMMWAHVFFGAADSDVG